MRKAVRLGLVATALMFASPALASDFSGVGRFFFWGIMALAALVAVPLVLLARKGRRGTTQGNSAIAIIVAAIFAPAVAYRDFEQWQLIPFPGSLVAMADGSWAELFPVPLISLVICALGLFWALQRIGTPANVAGGAP